MQCPHVNVFFVYLILNITFVGLPIFIKVPSSLAAPKELSTLQETCQAKGFPPPMLNWTRLGMPLPVGKTEIKGGTLTIKNLSPVDSGLYECVATNSLGIKKARMNLVVQQLPRGLFSFKTLKLSLLKGASLNPLRSIMLNRSQPLFPNVTIYVTIILRGRAGYRMIDNQRGA